MICNFTEHNFKYFGLCIENNTKQQVIFLEKIMASMKDENALMWQVGVPGMDY